MREFHVDIGYDKRWTEKLFPKDNACTTFTVKAGEGLFFLKKLFCHIYVSNLMNRQASQSTDKKTKTKRSK